MRRSEKLLVCLVAIAGAAFQPSAPKLELEVHVQPRGGELAELLAGGELVASRRGQKAKQAELRWPLRATSRVSLPAGIDWQLSCHGPKVWCPVFEISSARSAKQPQQILLPLQPAVVVAGSLRGEPAEALPATMIVQASILQSGGSQTIEMQEEVAVSEGAYSFLAPRGVHDLRFAFDGWAPVYRWGLKAEAERVRVPSIQLRRGASLSGWLRDRESELPIEGATLTVSASSSRAPDQEERLKERVPVTGPLPDQMLLAEGMLRAFPELGRLTVITDSNGFFQMAGLPPGNLRLRAESPQHAPLVLDPVEVVADAEILLGELALTSPVDVAVDLQPAAGPQGKPWRLQLSATQSTAGEEPIEITASKGGRAEVRGLRPAHYVLTVLSDSGDVLAFQEVEAMEDLELYLRLPLVEVEGAVHLGREPLQAHVVLETGEGDRVELESNEEGNFAGFMRRPERPWLMATVVWEEAEQERRRTLELEPPLFEEHLELELELPDGGISGIVVDAEGRPVPGARVSATPAGERGFSNVATDRADAEGSFHLPALEQKLYLVRATGSGTDASQSWSEVLSLDLSASHQVSGVQLVLWPTQLLEGLVLTNEGHGVSGALIDIDAFGRTPISTSAISAADGSFRTELPKDAERAVVTVLAPSQLLWSRCLQIDDGRLVTRLPPTPGGTLTVRIEGPADILPMTSGSPVVMTEEGGFFELGVLTTWQRRMNGQASSERTSERLAMIYQVPAMAPGGYAILWSGEARWQLALRSCSRAYSGLEWVRLAPGAEAGLDLGLLGRENLHK